MQKSSSLGKTELEHIVSQYDISSIRSYKLLSGGSENTNYLLETNVGTYVLSICEQKTIEQAKELSQLLLHLDVQSFNSSKIVLSKENQPFIVWQGKPVIIKDFIEGNIVEDLSFNLLQKIGRELAKLHQVEAPDYLPLQLGYGIEQFGKVKEYAPESEFCLWLGEIERYVTPFLKLDLPKALIHSDLFWSNVIVNDDANSVTIMDFEEACYYFRVFDIGMAVIGTCGEGGVINVEKAKQFLIGYQSEIQLTSEELSALRAFIIYAGASMTYWRHQNFNFVKSDPAMFEHYRGLQVLVDYMMTQDEDLFVQLGSL